MREKTRTAQHASRRTVSTRLSEKVSSGTGRGSKGLRKMAGSNLQLQLSFPGGVWERPCVQGNVGSLPKEDFAQVPHEWREGVERIYRYVSEVRRRNASGATFRGLRRTIKEVARSIGDDAAPSRKTVTRWYRRFIASGEDVPSLAPLVRNRRDGHRQIQPEVLKIIEDIFFEQYLSPRMTGIKAVWESVVRRIHKENGFRPPHDNLAIPAYSTVRSEVRRLTKGKRLVVFYGNKTMAPKSKAVTHRVLPTRPLERVEIDHTQLDILVVDLERGIPLGRPWLTFAIDVNSKCVLGYYIGFNPPSYLSVMQCLRHVIAPKSFLQKKYPCVVNCWDAHGLPETVVVDNGIEFRSTHFEDACLQLGILIQYKPIRLAWYKDSLERHFRTLNTRHLHQQPRTTFHGNSGKGDCDPQKNTVISVHILDEILHTWIVDDYHRRLHPKTKLPPADAWKRGVAAHPPALSPRREELEILGMTGERVISPWSKGAPRYHSGTRDRRPRNRTSADLKDEDVPNSSLLETNNGIPRKERKG